MNIRIALLLALACATSFGASAIDSSQSADVVLGQTDFVSKLAPASPTATSMAGPSGVAVDPTTGKVFVADTTNNRVLRYDSAAALISGSPAEAVLGQPDLFSKGSATTPKEMSTPIGLAIDSAGTLWVADSGNHRVLRFDHVSSKAAASVNADGVLGQPDFSTKANPTPPTQASMNSPRAVAVDANGTLWVADSVNNRVLRFDTAANAINGANADGVLGQPSFSVNFGNGIVTQYTMYEPSGVAADSAGHLWVSDSFNLRVLRFDNAANAGNGALANGVLGQPDFVSSAGTNPPTAGSMSPLGLAVDASGSLWVSDFGNRRALRFDNAASKANNADADAVVGQIDFVSKLNPNPPTQDGLSGVFALTVDAAGGLWIADTSNSRVLHYTPQAISNPPAHAPAAVAVAVSGKKKISTSAPAVAIKGTASCADGVAHVQYRVGKKGGFKNAGGTTAWKFKAKLQPGKNTITIHAIGATGAQTTTTVVVIRG